LQPNLLTDVLMPIALGVIMLGLGLSLTVDDFRRVIVYPRAVVVGLVCQTLVLPFVCYGVAKAFGLPPALAVGLMLLAASPGGATANLFSHLAKGDVALNITLTATNSLLSLLTLPLIVQLSMTAFLGAGGEIPMQFGKIIQVFGIILVPVGLGMLLRSLKKSVALALEKPVRILSALFLVLVIAGAIKQNIADVKEYFILLAAPALVFNLASMAVGYFVPLGAKVPRRQAVAIGMEIGIHNGTLAMFIATNVLGDKSMAMPPAIYSLIMFFTAAAFGFAVSRAAGREEAEKA
jgi:bile acid:Na+ symporter, BASS family